MQLQLHLLPPHSFLLYFKTQMLIRSTNNLHYSQRQLCDLTVVSQNVYLKSDLKKLRNEPWSERS